LTIFYSVFQNYTDEMDSHLLCSMFNVIKQFFSKHVLNKGLVDRVLRQLVSY